MQALMTSICLGMSDRFKLVGDLDHRRCLDLKHAFEQLVRHPPLPCPLDR